MLKQFVHQDRNQTCVLGELHKTRLQQQAIGALQFRVAGVAQPVRHAAQRVEQVTQLAGHAVAAGAQTEVADRPLHPFRLQ